jgi:hypothetical protein
MGEDGVDGFCGGDEGEDAHVCVTVGAGEGEELVDAGAEASPGGADGALRGVRKVGDNSVSGGAGIVRLAAYQTERAGGRRAVVAAAGECQLNCVNGR